MEKQLKLRSKILKLLPKTVASITFTFKNHPLSPKIFKPHGGKGYSGQIATIKPKNINRNDFEEPTSPKISCMGQIKHKKKHNKKEKEIEIKKQVTTFRKMLFHAGKPKTEGRRKSDACAAHDKKNALEERTTNMSQMKRFASGRNTFANFDWKAHEVVAEEIDDYYSDEERIQSDDEEEEEFMIPFSAPLYVGGGVAACSGGLVDLKPRKEINLWKRRTMAPPRPLQLDPVN